MGMRGGVDLGGTKIQTAIVGEGDAVVGSVRVPTPEEGSQEEIVDAMIDGVRQAAKAAGVSPAELDGVGVGAPGSFDPKTGDLLYTANLPCWKTRYPMGKRMKEMLGTDIFVGNDVSVATMGEFELGAGAKYRAILGVFWGTGVGGGIVIDGKLWNGRGAAGEIGHMVVELDGALCPCGRHGCMEAYAGREAMERKARHEVDHGKETVLFDIMRDKKKDRLSSAVWASALKKGDHMAHELIDRAVRYLGAGIGSAVNLLDVEAVVFGGGMGTRLGMPYLKEIEKAMEPHLWRTEDRVKLELAALGDLGGSIGASLLVPTPEATR